MFKTIKWTHKCSNCGKEHNLKTSVPIDSKKGTKITTQFTCEDFCVNLEEKRGFLNIVELEVE